MMWTFRFFFFSFTLTGLRSPNNPLIVRLIIYSICKLVTYHQYEEITIINVDIITYSSALVVVPILKHMKRKTNTG